MGSRLRFVKSLWNPICIGPAALRDKVPQGRGVSCSPGRRGSFLSHSWSSFQTRDKRASSWPVLDEAGTLPSSTRGREGLQTAPLPPHSTAREGESKTSLWLEPRKNGFHQLPLEAPYAPQSPGGAQYRRDLGKPSSTSRCKTLPHSAGTPALSRNSSSERRAELPSCSSPQAGKAFAARRRRSSKRLQDKRGTPGPQGLRGRSPKDDAQEDWGSSKPLTEQVGNLLMPTKVTPASLKDPLERGGRASARDSAADQLCAA